jgi:hypothetical protein
MGSARRRVLPLKRSSMDASSLGAESASRTSHPKAAISRPQRTSASTMWREASSVMPFRVPIVGEERGGVVPIDGSPYWLLIRPPPARHGRGARRGNGWGRTAALVGGSHWDAMTHIRWGRILEHAAEIGRVTVKPHSGVAFQGRDRSTHNAPSPRGCCRGTFARGYALTSSEPRRQRR